jgi:hypothetical protein
MGQNSANQVGLIGVVGILQARIKAESVKYRGAKRHVASPYVFVVHINFWPLPFIAHSSDYGYIFIGVSVNNLMQPIGEDCAIIINKGNDLARAVGDAYVSGVSQAFGLLISDDPYVVMLLAIVA